MKVQTSFLPVLLALAALAGMPRVAAADAKATERPIADFVNAQGTFDFGQLFVPGVPNFLGWSDSTSQLSLSIDYAGLADKACNGVAGTVYTGKVRETPLPDGRAEVTVELSTLDAITFVVSGFDFGNDPVLFGVRWAQDSGGGCVMNGAPALGDSQLRVTLVNTSPGAPLPDLIQLVVAPEPGQELRAISLHARATGKLADGAPAFAETTQVVKPHKGQLRASTENIIVRPLSGKESQ